MQIENETKKLKALGDQVADLQNNHEDIYADLVHNFHNLMTVDPYMLKVAREVSGQEEPDPRCLPKVLDKFKDMNTEAQRKITELDPKYLTPVSQDDNSKEANEYREMQQAIAHVTQLFENKGINISGARENLRLQRDTAEYDNQTLREQLEDKQNRLNQAANFMRNTYIKATGPVVDNTHIGELGTEPTNWERAFPLGQSALRMTNDNFWDIAYKAGINNYNEMTQMFEAAGITGQTAPSSPQKNINIDTSEITDADYTT